jgi:hypothetical protein
VQQTAARSAVARARFSDCLIRRDKGPRAHVALALGDAIEAGAYQLFGSDAARGDLCRGFYCV